jgi:hypothetical protein
MRTKKRKLPPTDNKLYRLTLTMRSPSKSKTHLTIAAAIQGSMKNIAVIVQRAAKSVVEG